MNPTISVGVFSQRFWPQAGDPDECWALADMMALHAVASWLILPGITKYRTEAGNPREPGPTGGTIKHSERAIKALFPEIGSLIDVHPAGELTPATIISKIKPHGAASVSVLSSKLPEEHRYGFNGTHRVAVAITGDLRIGNPLAPAHSKWKMIEEDQLKAAIAAYPEGIGGGVIFMPTVEAAFRTHPLFSEAAHLATAGSAPHA